MWVFLVCLTALQVKLGHWIYTETNPKPYSRKLPPGSMGLPIIGETIFCSLQISHILPSICKGFILPSQIRFFQGVFWVRQKFLVANRLFFFVVICRQQKDIDQKQIKKQRKLIALASISNFQFHFCLHAEVACEARIRDRGM